MRSRAGLVLIAILLVVVTGAATIFWFVARDLTAQASSTQVNELLLQTESTAKSQIEGSIASADRVSEALSFLAESGADNATAEWAMYQSLTFVPELSGVYLAEPDGSFHFVLRTADGFLTKLITPDAAVPTERVVFTERDDKFNPVSTWVDPADAFDPLTRSWYAAAQASLGTSVWTDPYSFFTSGEPGITQATSSPDGSWVVGVDVELVALVRLLDDLSVMTAGEVFIFDGENTVLDRHGLTDLDGARGIADHARVQSSIAALTHDGQGLVTERTSYETSGRTHTVSATKFDLGTREWFLITDISPQEVPVPIAGLVRGLQALALTMAVAAVLAIIALTIPATRPIARLEREASIDALTSLPNRRAILHNGEALVMAGSLMSVAMVDVDKFKLVNDTHGHAIGDEVLRGLALRLRASGCDVGRLGGEEFVILLNGHDIASGTAIADKLRASVASEPFVTVAGPIGVTVSIGIAQHRAGQPFAATLGQADGALLESKLRGRDQVTAATEKAARARTNA